MDFVLVEFFPQNWFFRTHFFPTQKKPVFPPADTRRVCELRCGQVGGAIAIVAKASGSRQLGHGILGVELSHEKNRGPWVGHTRWAPGSSYNWVYNSYN